MSSVLGIFGGTFDPVHCGHLELAREVRAALRLADVVVVARPGVAFDQALPPPLAAEWTARFRDDASALSTEQAGAIIVQPITAHAIAASAIRAELGRGADGIAAVRSLLPAAVL